jgi:ribonuclease HI
LTNPKVTIYTDGGCVPNPGVGGFAALLMFEDGQQKEISGGELESTNNRMELTAAIMALETLPTSYEVDLYTDSQYLKNGITEWIKNWIKKNWRDVKNPDLWKRLYTETKRHQIHWHWVKGHAGHEHNERVDMLAMKEIEKLSGISPKTSSSTAPSGEKVNIYASAAMAGRNGSWGVVIVDEQAGEKQLFGSEANTSANRLHLVAAITALEKIDRVSQINFYTDSEYLEKGIQSWIHGWLKNNWRTASGEPVKNQDQWKKLYALHKKHSVKWILTVAASNHKQRSLEIASGELKKAFPTLAE